MTEITKVFIPHQSLQNTISGAVDLSQMISRIRLFWNTLFPSLKIKITVLTFFTKTAHLLEKIAFRVIIQRNILKMICINF